LRRTAHLLLGGLLVIANAGVLSRMAAQSSLPSSKTTIDPLAHLSDFQVFELRRYVIKQGEREHFSKFFDTYFPDAFQQVGNVVAGSFVERKNENVFTWIRGCHSAEDRAIASSQFYYGSVWKEHRKEANDFITNADNDMLLRPLTPERSIPVLPSVDPISENERGGGIVVAQIFTVTAKGVESFANAAEPTFAGYRALGVREAGVLVTFDGPNTYPLLTVRSDGPFLVWLGIVKDDTMLETLKSLVERSLPTLSATGLLRSDPELVILDPTRRSRLRWLH
jgi:hypothetical protein